MLEVSYVYVIAILVEKTLFVGIFINKIQFSGSLELNLVRTCQTSIYTAYRMRRTYF